MCAHTVNIGKYAVLAHRKWIINKLCSHTVNKRFSIIDLYNSAELLIYTCFWENKY
jgi:hypothetical protein